MMDRREFLFRTGALCLLAAAPPVATAGQLAGRGREDVLWQTIGAVQDHLFPSEAETPGAREARATEYLQLVLSDHGLGEGERKMILQGAEKLQQLSHSEQQCLFVELDFEEREQLLRLFEREHHGGHWLSTILDYILEALLTDPVYGGNPKMVGWQWLNHRPGFRRPSHDTRFYQLPIS